MKAVSLGMGLALAATPRAQAQDQLAHVRDLYSNAAYEDVLSTLAVETSAPSPEVGQYKVFSLVALGRAAEAEKAAEAMIIANPRFQPDRDASPRVRELFTSVRKRIAPDLLKSMYVNAKASLDRKDRDAAIQAFSEVIAVAEDADLRSDVMVGELRLLASGFLDLSRALPAAAPAAGPASENRVALVPDLPEPTPAPQRPLPQITPAVPINERVPPLTAPEMLAGRELHGRIRLRIDAEGQVVSSEILTPSLVFYDEQLLAASRRWRYKPALANGSAVPSERIIEVALKPR